MTKELQGNLQLDLSGDGIDRVINFLGYGCPSAPVWFIGLEEGLGKANSQEGIDNLKARDSFKPIMDLHEAHKLLQEKGGQIDIELKKSFTQVWIWMAKIVRARRDLKDWSNVAFAKEYVRRHLGRAFERPLHCDERQRRVRARGDRGGDAPARSQRPQRRAVDEDDLDDDGQLPGGLGPVPLQPVRRRRGQPRQSPRHPGHRRRSL